MDKLLATFRTILVPVASRYCVFLLTTFSHGDILIHNLATPRAEANRSVCTAVIEVGAIRSLRHHSLSPTIQAYDLRRSSIRLRRGPRPWPWMNGNASFEARLCELRRDVAPGVLMGPRVYPWGSISYIFVSKVLRVATIDRTLSAYLADSYQLFLETQPLACALLYSIETVSKR